VRRVVLLPGLDGTAALFEPLLRATPPGIHAEAVALPAESLKYTELAERLLPKVRPSRDTVIVAESFSGPIAVILAARHPVGALVLCNSFVTPPLAGPLVAPLRAFARAARLLFRLQLPAAALRQYFVGPDASDAQVAWVRGTVASVPPAVLASRVRAVLSVDVTAELARCHAPILYLRGTEDHLVSEASTRAISNGAGRTVSVTRLASPHLILQTAPEAAWRAIVEWLAVLPPVAPSRGASSLT
jgi:pimeloyl-ACP methyl ester carboxylesterase